MHQVYISEIAHSRVRGMLGSCVQLMVVTGILGAYVAGTWEGASSVAALRFSCAVSLHLWPFVREARFPQSPVKDEESGS